LPILRRAALAALAFAMPVAAFAANNSVVIGMALEPPGLDPTMAPAAAIGEIVHYNILEGLTKIEADGSVSPLLAERWSVADGAKTYTFTLRDGVKFQNGQPLTSGTVKFSFERNAAPDSTNKEKAVFANMASVETPDPRTVVLKLKEPNPNLLFNLGENTGVILEPTSAAATATQPVGTGPYKLESWVKGSTVTLAKWDGYRAPETVAIGKATFRIINDSAAQVTALLSGDVDAIPRFAGYDSLQRFQDDSRFVVTVGTSEGKTILAINNGRKPFDDVRVRRALSYAVDRQSVIDGSSNGLGTPIGSHYASTDPGYVDLTAMYPYDPAKAQALLAEAGVRTPLQVTLALPPPAYARQAGEIIAAELAQVGVDARIENVEWAQWLDGVYKNKNYDLTVISHVEPRDLGIYANPDYYFQYRSPAFQELYHKLSTTADEAQRLDLLRQAQRLLAEDAVNVFLYLLPQVTVAKKELVGLWRNSPIFANDLAALTWQ
jgi:peptide/nickel transport system substrate-binding protein